MNAKAIYLLSSGQDLKALEGFVNSVFAEKAEAESWEPWKYFQKRLGAMLANPRGFYHSFTIPKKSGGSRQIDAPQKSLKLLQASLIPVFEAMLVPSPDAFGFLPGRSIVDNAKAHLGKDTVLNVDIKGFFPSITTGRLTTVFRNAKDVQVSAYMARSLARLVTLDGRLPQGSPASPVLTNLVSVRLDARLAGLARKYGCRYSRYVDDISFSASGPRALHRLMPHLESILNREGFGLNPDKTRIQSASMRQEVTGLVLSHAKSTVPVQVNTPRKFRRVTRSMLHSWRQHGLLDAATRSGMVGDGASGAFVNTVRGRIAHLRHVAETAEVQRFKVDFDELIKRDLK